MTDTSDDDGVSGLFNEPDGFYQAEKEPSCVSYKTRSGQELTLRLVGHNPLWGHLLWQGGRTLADYLEQNAATLINHNTILELGAGAGLPSLVCALNGAHQVVVTDYPDADLIENLRHNITHCPHLSSPPNIVAEGYLWGADTSSLTSHLPSGSDGRFDVLILADLLFNHSEHAKLLRTVQQTLAKTSSAQALVFFTPYRPWLYEKDLAFLDLARAGGFEIGKIFEKVMERVMFEEDPGVSSGRKYRRLRLIYGSAYEYIY